MKIFDGMASEVRETTKGMVVWSCIFTALLAVIVLIVMGCFSGWTMLHTQVLLGFIAGCGLACFMTIHMAISVGKSLELDESSALTDSKKRYLIRTTIIFVIMIGLYFTGMFNILSMLGGLLSLKPATYMQMFFQSKTYEPVDELVETDNSDDERGEET